MPLNLEQKKAIVSEMTDVCKTSVSAAIADYRGLTVSEMTDLRSKARESGVYLRVVRNTLARLACKGTDYECLQDVLVGPLVLLFSKEEPGAAARLLKDFTKQHDSLEVKGLVVGGELLAADRLKEVAALPSRDEAIALLMSVMQAPITKLVRTLAEPGAMLARTVSAVGDQKEAA